MPSEYRLEMDPEFSPGRGICSMPLLPFSRSPTSCGTKDCTVAV